MDWESKVKKLEEKIESHGARLDELEGKNLLDLQVEKRMKASGENFRDALDHVLSENPGLMAVYESRHVRQEQPEDLEKHKAQAELHRLASELVGKLGIDYTEAVKRVSAENPEIAEKARG